MAQVTGPLFLVEVGTEELPPKALKTLMTAFATNLDRGLQENRLDHGDLRAFASPRRLAVFINGLALAQEGRTLEMKGPPTKVAFDGDGNPTAAAEAFAKKCGASVGELTRTSNDKGEWLAYTATEAGVSASLLLPKIVEHALQALPIPRRMRWGASDIEFVRPVHWVLMLHGEDVVAGSVMGRSIGRTTMGHRFMSSGEISVAKPDDYRDTLFSSGFVDADFSRREKNVRNQVAAAAQQAGGQVVSADGLYEEVAALTEWPVAMVGHFDEAFLELPSEAIIASLTGHQRYFPIADATGQLLPAFVFVANLESKDPTKVSDGNERVIRPRLADAAFFWEQDKQHRLDSRGDELDRVVYQKGLGSLKEKSARVASLAGQLAESLSLNGADAVRAAALAKADLLSGMVGEFPELQGTMGRYYALADGEPDEVAQAIGEQYLPRFAGDALPASNAGRLLALADKLDTLAGVFVLGKAPSGSKDPFGLRRAALGVVRLLVECDLELAVRDIVSAAVELQPAGKLPAADVAEQLTAFIVERLRGYYVDRETISAEMFDAVATSVASGALTLPDFDQRMQAVQLFAEMAGAESLAAANKRISNILDKATTQPGPVDPALFEESAERALFAALDEALADVRPLQDQRDYAAVLARLAVLGAPIDRFFDEVMVMSDDAALQGNRLALLSMLQAPFQSVADISRLSSGKRPV